LNDLRARNWREIIRPKTIEKDEESYADTYGKFVCEPLERGFGITIGNALRRILLSSLQGAAIVWVKIDGVPHEFSSIPGVLEDVTEIVLNLKEIRFKLLDSDEAEFTLEKVGEGEVKAKDINTHGKAIVLNPDKHIATLTTDTKFKMTMHVKMGKGYVPSERLKTDEVPIGTIYLDAAFSPIKKVSYTVTNARVGQIADYDRLTMEVWTDGSVAPEDALAYAAKILKEQMAPFINFEEEPEPKEEEETQQEQQLNENLYKKVSELELSVRAANCLKNANIRYIGELVQKTEAEMLKTKNFGRTSLKEIKEILEGMGLSFGMKIPNWVPPEEDEDESDFEEEEGRKK